MKKTFILLAAVCVSLTASAQTQITSPKGFPVLPESGDWSLGIDVTPFANYAGNFFTDAANTAPSFNFTSENPMVIYGKYVVSPDMAYRAKIRLGFGSNTVNYDVQNDASTSTPPGRAFDEVKTSSTNIALGAGIQKWRGKSRVRGLYGAEAMIGLSGGKTTYSYANAFSADNNTPSTGVPGQSSSSRTTESKLGSTFHLAIRGFIGVEYFFAAKMSVSGEFGWGLGLNSTGEGEVTTETLNATFNGGQTTTVKTGKASSFGIDTDNASGSINLNFYF